MFDYLFNNHCTVFSSSSVNTPSLLKACLVACSISCPFACKVLIASSIPFDISAEMLSNLPTLNSDLPNLSNSKANRPVLSLAIPTFFANSVDKCPVSENLYPCSSSSLVDFFVVPVNKFIHLSHRVTLSCASKIVFISVC